MSDMNRFEKDFSLLEKALMSKYAIFWIFAITIIPLVYVGVTFGRLYQHELMNEELSDLRLKVFQMEMQASKVQNCRPPEQAR